jgi:hypothetical protein
MLPPPASCHICAVPLTAAHARTAPLCGSAACHAQYQATPAWRRCSVCARPLTDQELASRVCSAGACRHEWIIARVQRRRLALAEHAHAFRATAAATARIDAPDRFAIGIVPKLYARISRLPARRRRIIAAHLETLARQAAELRAQGIAPDRSEVPTAPRHELAAVLGRACGRCRGYCCTSGADHAYLRVETLHRWLDDHPDQDADAAVAAYLAYVGPRTVNRSCQFHRSDGCSLPRDMRADICNRFLCDGLVRISEAAPNDGPVHAFVATMKNMNALSTSFHSGAFVDARDVRVVRRRPTAPE